MKKTVFSTALAIACLCYCSISFAERDRSGVSRLLPIVCAKKAIEFEDGALRFGALKSNKPRIAYRGPSIICKTTEKITENTGFIVMGSRKSTFGKRWYYINIFEDRSYHWIPAKYVTLGKKYDPDVASKNISPITLSAKSALSTRACPRDYCKVVSTLVEGKHYIATKKSENGWYLINVTGARAGWVKTTLLDEVPKPIPEKVIEPVEEEYVKPQLRLSEKKKVVRRPKPTFDPCRAKVPSTYYKEKRVWHLQEDLALKSAPHAQCGDTFSLKKGAALVSLGETEEFYIIAAAPDATVFRGYLLRSEFTNQYIAKMTLRNGVKIYSSDFATELHGLSEYWNSLEYKMLSKWRSLKKWFRINTGLGFKIIAFALGVLCIIPSSTRRLLLRADQQLLRGGYFFIRSPEFWRMLRRLIFILVVTSCILIALVFYVLWLKNVANYVEMGMGLGSLALMSLSVGWFGVRVASFFTGLLLFVFSVFQFIIFVIQLYLLFLLPSLLLLLWYYRIYRRSGKDAHSQSGPFDHERVERIHQQVFRLRNFYPETIISWVRVGGARERWNKFREVMRARSSILDPFFNTINKNAEVVS